jgi:hypothetical protein
MSDEANKTHGQLHINRVDAVDVSVMRDAGRQAAGKEHDYKWANE